MIGKLLKGRYQIVQFINAGAFGQIYLAEDIHQPGFPKCIVKYLKSFSQDPRCLPAAKRRFISETFTLKRLGHHDQIPQLLACFEDKQEFYLVQEFVQGHALNAELPIRNGCLKCWTEQQVIQLLQEVLGILEFVHSQGIIHCDIKPNNLIRRIADDKLFLIDFGAVQTIRGQSSIYRQYWKGNLHNISSSLLGYTPAEQLIGYTCPNSDIYALGAIAIQALIGLEPSQLQAHPETREIQWQHLYQAKTDLSHKLAEILTKMVRYDFRERYQSVSEVLAALQQLAHIPVPVLVGGNNQVKTLNVRSLTMNSQPEIIFDPTELDLPTEPASNVKTTAVTNKPSPLLTGMGVGIAVNTLAISFGLYSLVHTATSDSEPDILNKATEDYQRGDLNEAIALAESIPNHSSVYPEAQAAIMEWRQDWQLAIAQFQAVEKAFNEQRWLEVVIEARKIPPITYWQNKAQLLVKKVQPQIDAEAQTLLQQAYEQALNKDFTAALKYLQQIPPEASAIAIVQQKRVEYSQKQEIKADYLLQQAFNLAATKDFQGALEYLREIPPGTAAYAKAEAKIDEYLEKQRIKDFVATTPPLTLIHLPQIPEVPQDSKAETPQDLNPGNRLQEAMQQYLIKTTDELNATPEEAEKAPTSQP